MLVELKQRAYDGLTCVWVKESQDTGIWRITRVYDADAVESPDYPAAARPRAERRAAE